MKSSTRMKHLRKEAGLSQADIGQMLNISQPCYQSWEKGTHHPNPQQLVELADIFNVSLDYLVRRNDDRFSHKLMNIMRRLSENQREAVLRFAQDKLPEQNENNSELLLSYVPPQSQELFPYHVHDQFVSAGIGLPVQPGTDTLCAYWDQKVNYDFGVWVKGDSMSPTLQDHEVALIVEAQDTLEDKNGIYLVCWNHHVYIKRVRLSKDALYLVSDNPKYPDLEIPAEEECWIAGRVVAHFFPSKIE